MPCWEVHIPKVGGSREKEKAVLLIGFYSTLPESSARGSGERRVSPIIVSRGQASEVAT